MPLPCLAAMVEDGITLKMKMVPLPPHLNMSTSVEGRIYSYDRTKYRLERVADKCSETQEAFKLVEKESK
jgi:hypothetical protein